MIIAELNLKMKAENTKQKEIEDELRAKVVELEQKYMFSSQQYQSAKNTIDELTVLITDIKERMAIFGQKESENIAKIERYEKSIVLLQKVVKIHKKNISKLNIKQESDKPESYVPAKTYAIDEPQNFSFFKLLQNDKEKVDESIFQKMDEILIDSIDENPLQGRIMVVESICPLEDEDSWEAYSNFDCTGKPVKISLKKDTPKFMLQLNGRLNVCDAEIDVNSLLSHLHSCHLKDLRLVDQKISENDFIKLVSSKALEKFIFIEIL
uniref:Uncharacterized protein n=1 Tax=Panagrolaimus superbus TaxID=310955 RepID=A0A914XW15_9BILA